MHVVASYPTITLSTVGCIRKGQSVSLTCDVTYNGTNLMPMKMQWDRRIWNEWLWAFHPQGRRTKSTVNASSIYRSSYAFTPTGQTTDYLECTVTFSPPTGLVLGGVDRQYSNSPNANYLSSLFAPRTVASKSRGHSLQRIPPPRHNVIISK